MAAGCDEIMRWFLPEMDNVGPVEETDAITGATRKVIRQTLIAGDHFDPGGPAQKDLGS